MEREGTAATQTVSDPSGRRIAELTRERDTALAAAASERDRIAIVIRQCDQLAAEVFAWRKRHERQAEKHAVGQEESRQREHELALQLAHARATIGNMERSRFWQMRVLWVRIRRLIGR